jgi:hypothetical protein
MSSFPMDASITSLADFRFCRPQSRRRQLDAPRCRTFPQRRPCQDDVARGHEKKLGHNLPRVWDAFKAQANDPTLARFDSVISRLDKFEKLRYPDDKSKGMNSMFDITKAGAAAVDAMTASAPAGSVPASTLPQYRFVLEDIDESVAAIFAAASRNPKAYFGAAFRQEARDYIVKDNAVRAIVEGVPVVKPAA